MVYVTVKFFPFYSNDVEDLKSDSRRDRGVLVAVQMFARGDTEREIEPWKSDIATCKLPPSVMCGLC